MISPLKYWTRSDGEEIGECLFCGREYYLDEEGLNELNECSDDCPFYEVQF